SPQAQPKAAEARGDEPQRSIKSVTHWDYVYAARRSTHSRRTPETRGADSPSTRLGKFFRLIRAGTPRGAQFRRLFSNLLIKERGSGINLRERATVRLGLPSPQRTPVPRIKDGDDLERCGAVRLRWNARR